MEKQVSEAFKKSDIIESLYNTISSAQINKTIIISNSKLQMPEVFHDADDFCRYHENNFAESLRESLANCLSSDGTIIVELFTNRFQTNQTTPVPKVYVYGFICNNSEWKEISLGEIEQIHDRVIKQIQNNDIFVDDKKNNLMALRCFVWELRFNQHSIHLQNCSLIAAYVQWIIPAMGAIFPF